MKNFKLFTFFFITIFLVSQKSYTQTYNGKMVIFFRDTLEGKITVDLTGENKDLIYIETETKTTTKKKGAKETATVTEKNGYNPAIITSLIIDGKTYRFKDLKNDYKQENNLEKCCVERIAGNDSLALYQWTDKNGILSYYSISPRFNEYGENIAHPKYNDIGFRSFIGIKFSRCKTLGDKIYNMETGYHYDNKTASLEEKLLVWKNIIRDYIACW